MTTTVQITDISSILDLSAIYDGHEADYDTDAVQAAYIDLLQDDARKIAPSVTVHANGMVIADTTDADAARGIDWRELADDIDLSRILQANDRTVIDSRDITAALHAADIAYAVEHPGTLNESIHVRAASGRTVAFGPGRGVWGNETGRGVDIAYYRSSLDSDVTSTDWVETVGQLVEAIRRFLV